MYRVHPYYQCINYFCKLNFFMKITALFKEPEALIAT